MPEKKIGDPIVITLSLKAIKQMIGLAARIQFDPAILVPVDLNPAVPGTQLKHEYFNVLPNAAPLLSLQKDSSGNEIGNGLLEISLAQQPPYVPTDIDADVLDIHFICIGAGETEVKIVPAGTMLRNPNMQIPTTIQNSDSIVVETLEESIIMIKVR